MKYLFIHNGKTRFDYLRKGEEEYLKRLKIFINIEELILPEIKQNKGLSEKQLCELEGKNLLEKLETSDLVVLLDERGSTFSSIELSRWLEQNHMSGKKRMVFVTGGPYGFSDEVYQRADKKLSLSKLTFSHQMVRLFFYEQMYRAQTILKGMPYHHE